MCRLMDQQALQEQFKDLEYLAADFLEREDFESAQVLSTFNFR